MNSDMFVKEINIAVISALVPFVDRYPTLKNVLEKSKRSSNDWDFFMTVAGVGTFLMVNEIDKEGREKLVRQLIDLDKQMTGALINLEVFLKNNSGMNVNKSAIVGLWVLWNIAGEAPTHEVGQILAPAIGSYLLNLVKDLEA